ncbi:MAG: ORF6N domain-containing protein [Bacteriovoracaceae bacterium]|nr:ORF6N domain-containing protein [Bacteriovoracaceae bacterium]
MSDELVLQIDKMIYVVRGQRVMLDSDLAKLYGVETRSLNQVVRRNTERFPEDFMFQPNSSELAYLRSQYVILGNLSTHNYINKYRPHLFTENGVAMLSTVLKSKQAIQVNIAIMRIFTKLRSYTVLEQSLQNEIYKLKDETGRTFKIVFERLDDLESLPEIPNPIRKKIGLKNE